MQSLNDDQSGYKIICVRQVRIISKLDGVESCFEFSLQLRSKRMDGSDLGRMSSCVVNNGLLGTRFEISGLDDVQALGYGLHYIDHTLFLLQGACDVWVDEHPFVIEQRSAFFTNPTKQVVSLGAPNSG